MNMRDQLSFLSTEKAKETDRNHTIYKLSCLLILSRILPL